MSRFGSPSRPQFKANPFRPRSRTPSKILREFLDEAARLIDLYDRIRLAHPGEFLEYFANSKIDLQNKSVDHYFRAWAVRNILDRGRGGTPDPSIEAVRAEALAAIEGDSAFDVLGLVRATGWHFGMAPLYSSIWEAQAWLDIIYSYSGFPDPQPTLELVGVECLEADIAVLKIYLAIAQEIGEGELLAMLGGGKVDFA